MSAVPPRVLLVDDDTGLLRTIQVLLEDEKGWTVEAVPSAPLALEKLRAAPFDVLLTDLSMPGGDGLYLLREARALQPELPVLLMTAFGSVRSAVEAMKLGAGSVPDEARGPGRADPPGGALARFGPGSRRRTAP